MNSGTRAVKSPLFHSRRPCEIDHSNACWYRERPSYPVSTVMNSPSPPNTTFLKPGSCCTSYFTVGANATTDPELTRSVSPSFKSRWISGPLTQHTRRRRPIKYMRQGEARGRQPGRMGADSADGRGMLHAAIIDRCAPRVAVESRHEKRRVLSFSLRRPATESYCFISWVKD